MREWEKETGFNLHLIRFDWTVALRVLVDEAYLRRPWPVILRLRKDTLRESLLSIARLLLRRASEERVHLDGAVGGAALPACREWGAQTAHLPRLPRPGRGDACPPGPEGGLRREDRREVRGGRDGGRPGPGLRQVRVLLAMTYYMEDLERCFAIGREIEVYMDVEHLIEKIRYYLKHDDEREAIAAAGHRRARSEHTYASRFAEIVQRVLADREARAGGRPGAGAAAR